MVKITGLWIYINNLGKTYLVNEHGDERLSKQNLDLAVL